MNRGKRGTNPDPMANINPGLEYWKSIRLNQQPVLKKGFRSIAIPDSSVMTVTVSLNGLSSPSV